LPCRYWQVLDPDFLHLLQDHYLVSPAPWSLEEGKHNFRVLGWAAHMKSITTIRVSGWVMYSYVCIGFGPTDPWG
jgi:hypothetical protein